MSGGVKGVSKGMKGWQAREASANRRGGQEDVEKNGEDMDGYIALH
jgi:hypothetical protein